MNQNPLMCFNGEIRAMPVFIAVHLKQSWIHYGLTETHFLLIPWTIFYLMKCLS